MYSEGVITSLQNHFLVATSSLNGSIFERTVIYVCTHDDNGAMGVIVNRPLNSVSFTDIADSMGVKPLIDKRPPTIYNGGPVDKNRGFVIHSPEYTLKNSMLVGKDISLSATADIVSDIAKGEGPQNLAFCLGYAGWSSGQLEQELVENSWLVLEADADTLFHVDSDEKYNYCTHKMGINALNFSESQIGLA